MFIVSFYRARKIVGWSCLVYYPINSVSYILVLSHQIKSSDFIKCYKQISIASWVHQKCMGRGKIMSKTIDVCHLYVWNDELISFLVQMNWSKPYMCQQNNMPLLIFYIYDHFSCILHQSFDKITIEIAFISIVLMPDLLPQTFQGTMCFQVTIKRLQTSIFCNDLQ